MDLFDQIATWISENESLFSGLAAIVALVAIVPAALRPVWCARRAGASEAVAIGSPAAQRGDEQAHPRLAVLPIEVLGSSEDLRGIAEMMTVEPTTLLARSRGCEVISRRSSTAFAAGGGTSRDFTAAALALARSDRGAAERHLGEADRLNPDLDSGAIARIIGAKGAELLAPLREAERLNA